MESNLQIELNKAFNDALIHGRGILLISNTQNGIEVKSIPNEDISIPNEDIKDLLEDLDGTL